MSKWHKLSAFVKFEEMPDANTIRLKLHEAGFKLIDDLDLREAAEDDTQI